MKKAGVFLLLIFIAMSLSAVEIDEALNTIFSYCSVIDHEGDQVLMTENLFDAEGDAYNWVANCSHVILAIKAGWVECPAAYSSSVSSLDAIGAAWATEYQTYVVTIPVWEILENFNDESYLDMEPDDFIQEIREYIDYYGDVSPLSMY